MGVEVALELSPSTLRLIPDADCRVGFVSPLDVGGEADVSAALVGVFA